MSGSTFCPEKATAPAQVVPEHPAGPEHWRPGFAGIASPVAGGRHGQPWLEYHADDQKTHGFMVSTPHQCVRTERSDRNHPRLYVRLSSLTSAVGQAFQPDVCRRSGFPAATLP